MDELKTNQERKTVRIQVRLTPSQYAQVKAKVAATGESRGIATILRAAGLQALQVMS